jgi:CubicO group peptidase (beta-lactamase class C family)
VFWLQQLRHAYGGWKKLDFHCGWFVPQVCRGYTMLRVLVAVLAVVQQTGATATQPTKDDLLGPGSGPWSVGTPESVGLSSAKLRASEEAVNDRVSGRVCYIVVKDGTIVEETYRLGHTQNSTMSGFSTTKSQCSSLYGIAREEGWADPMEPIAARNADTRQCNPSAEFRHSLSMTGESDDLAQPEWEYDTAGRRCLDTLSDFIEENNPEGVSAEEWKDRKWTGPLGIEHSTWTSGASGTLPCGSGAVMSCRDLARTALLWTNNGQWPEHGQLVSEEHISAGRRRGPEGPGARLDGPACERFHAACATPPLLLVSSS